MKFKATIERPDREDRMERDIKAKTLEEKTRTTKQRENRKNKPIFQRAKKFKGDGKMQLRQEKRTRGALSSEGEGELPNWWLLIDLVGKREKISPTEEEARLKLGGDLLSIGRKPLKRVGAYHLVRRISEKMS